MVVLPTPSKRWGRGEIPRRPKKLFLTQTVILTEKGSYHNDDVRGVKVGESCRVCGNDTLDLPHFSSIRILKSSVLFVLPTRNNKTYRCRIVQWFIMTFRFPFGKLIRKIFCTAFNRMITSKMRQKLK